MRQIEAIIAYLKHSYKAQSKYRIHSPFVFQFYDKILKNGTSHIEYRIVNRVRKELVLISRFIKRKDMGSKGKDYPSDQRFVRVRDVARYSCVSARKGEFLFRLTQEVNPAGILELGTSFGVSTMYFSLAAPHSRIITIEGCIDSSKVALENFEKGALKNITVITGSFEEKLSSALELMPSPDIVFFDGNHKKEPTLRYFEECLQHIHPGTVFVFDDIHWSADMGEAWKIITQHPKVKVSIDLYHLGVLYFKEELSKEDYILRF